MFQIIVYSVSLVFAVSVMLFATSTATKEYKQMDYDKSDW